MTQLAAERLLLALLPEAISCKGGSQYFPSVLLALLGALSLLALWRTRRPATQADAAPFFIHAGRFALALCLVAAYAAALPHVLSLPSVTGMVVGMLAGLVIGALPGLAVVAGVALLIPLTFGINPLAALGLMAGMYNGGSHGGAITAILQRIPGTPASAATVFDGYPMTHRGEAAYALRVAVVLGMVGSVLSALALMLLAPPLSRVTLLFGPAEYFWVAMFGMATVSILLGDDPIKGLISACIGLLLGWSGRTRPPARNASCSAACICWRDSPLWCR
jgi:hypothetical protein